MWPDNETTLDLIGFKVHADLIREVVTDENMLPVVLGVFGDWGSGKSSIMQMLTADLSARDAEGVVCIPFNGWVFEGYEDAKTALLTSILVQLGEHKRFGVKIKDKAERLLKRVKWMEVAKLGIKHVGVPLGGFLLASWMAQHGVGAPPQLPALPDPTTVNWGSAVADDAQPKGNQPALLEARKFREDFEQLLTETNVKTLVVLIDDLDRCLPERIIETLEAIKLFVSVPQTAFVIGADPRIVRHAIAKRYVERQLREEETKSEDEYNLVTDYLEKLIQVPYYLPRLSPSEVETYINLLVCRSALADPAWEKVRADWQARRVQNFYAAYGSAAVQAAVGAADMDPVLTQRLAWSGAVAPVITEGLKGNPRQVKRMLNAMLLREKLAAVAGIAIREDVLAKLMVLEYTYLERFKELYTWQAAEGGHPARLKKLEHPPAAGDPADAPESELKMWQTAPIKRWLSMQPHLSDIDLRDYFWLARDRTSSTLAGVAMISPLVRRLFDSLVNDNEAEQITAAGQTRDLSEVERVDLYQLLHQRVLRLPADDKAVVALQRLADAGVADAFESLLEAVLAAPVGELHPAVPYIILNVVQGHSEARPQAEQALEQLATSKQTPAGKAAAKALKGLRDGNK
ncbi:MAG: NTPase [Anaerolineales bacterium]|nr:NTPase [Anaerolineales bacterium]